MTSRALEQPRRPEWTWCSWAIRPRRRCSATTRRRPSSSGTCSCWRGPCGRRAGARVPRPARHPRWPRPALRQAIREPAAGDELRRRSVRRGRAFAALSRTRALLQDRPEGAGRAAGAAAVTDLDERLAETVEEGELLHRAARELPRPGIGAVADPDVGCKDDVLGYL